ncbi:MAG: hypothetical protein ACXVFQ_25175 [Solirubrobacteraceae bacterium]
MRIARAATRRRADQLDITVAHNDERSHPSTSIVSWRIYWSS